MESETFKDYAQRSCLEEPALQPCAPRYFLRQAIGKP